MVVNVNDKLRYLLLAVSIYSMFTNILDCIRLGASALTYVIYPGSLFLITMLLLFVSTNKIIPILFLLVGMGMILDSPCDVVSGGILFIVFGIEMLKIKWINIVVYALTAVTITSKNILYEANTATLINYLMVYGLLFAVQYLKEGMHDR
jgi:hypothetical protein